MFLSNRNIQRRFEKSGMKRGYSILQFNNEEEGGVLPRLFDFIVIKD